MATTSRGAFPYPLGGDPPDTDGAIKSLADRVAAVVTLFRQTAAALRGAAGAVGTIHHASDSGEVALDTGSAWLELLTRAAGDAAYVPLARKAVSAVVTSTQTGVTTTETSVAGLSVTTATLPANRRVRISVKMHVYSTVAEDAFEVRLYRDSGVTIDGANGQVVTANSQILVAFSTDDTPPSGEHTYFIYLVRTAGTGSLASYATSSVKATILVEDIGAAS